MGAKWTGGDPISGALVDLAANRGLPTDTPVTSDLVESAQRHGLVGLLDKEIDSNLVRAVASHLDARRRMKLRHLRRILERLDAAGIRATVLKGAFVGMRYRDPGIRTFGDLDIMVEESSLDRALEVLGTDEAAVGTPAKRPKADKRDILFSDRSGVSFSVDLHWNLFAYSQLRGGASGATTAAWGSAYPVRDSPFGPHWVLPEGIEICFLATHAILDHRFRLILFRDVAEIARGKTDWDDVVEAAGRWGLRAATYFPLWVARHAISARVPEDAVNALRVPSLITSYLEWALPRLDLVRFDGHSMHPVNLATVLLADTPSRRIALVARVPRAFPDWRRRVVSKRSTGKASRVLIVVNTDQRRGAEVFAERLAKGLMELGWVADAVSLTTLGGDARADVNPLTDFSPKTMGRLKPEIVLALRQRIASLNANIVVAIGPTLRYGVLANLGLKSRLVYVAIGEPRYWLRSRRSAVLNRMLMRRVDRVFAVSARTSEELIELEPKLATKVEVIHTGVPDDLFRIDRPPPHDPLHVVMIGSLSTEKAPRLALRAVAGVDGATIRFVGDGPLAGTLREEAVSLGIGDRVEFIGSVDEVAPHLTWADVLVLTSKTEGLPGVILEAGAAGVPAVSVDVGGVVEAIRHGVTGIVVAAGDLEALTEALRDLARDRERLIRMGEAARAHIRERFSMHQIVSRYVDALTRINA